MHRIPAFFLVALMLLQALGQELLVVNYQQNKSRITEQYCANKARPQLHCNGKYHLAQQLRKAEGGDKKDPELLAKVKYEVLPTAAFELALLGRWPLAAGRSALPQPHVVALRGRARPGRVSPAPLVRLIVAQGFLRGRRPANSQALPRLRRAVCARTPCFSVSC